MPTDYACVALEEGNMLRLAGSDIICYRTDEYAEGYFGGNPADYDLNDEVADIYAEVHMLCRFIFGRSRPLRASCCVIVLFILSMMIAFLQRDLIASAVPAGFREEPYSLNLSLLELLACSHMIQKCSQES
jgi:hypothetical protein